MRRFILSLCGLALLAAPALGGDGQVSKGALAKMGLGGMRVVGDQEASQIRGTSIAVTYSVASGIPIVSINSPFGVGNHFSFSASVGVSGSGIAGGFATARAH